MQHNVPKDKKLVSTDAALTHAELKNLVNNLTNNPELVNDLSPDKTVAVNRFIHPMGNIPSSKDLYINMSVTNMKDLYFRRLHTTALIGYLYRTYEEYEPEVELAKEEKKYLKKLSKLNEEYGVVSVSNACSTDSMPGLIPVDTDTTISKKSRSVVQVTRPSYEDALVALQADHKSRCKLIKSTCKGIVKQFLDRNFEYNPDQHVRPAHTENKKDSNRPLKPDEILKQVTNANKRAAVENAITNKSESTFKWMRNNILAVYQDSIALTNTLSAAINAVQNSGLKVQVVSSRLNLQSAREDLSGMLLKKYTVSLQRTADIKKMAEPLVATSVLSAWTVDPPADFGFQFDRYMSNHYEQLRDVVHAVYNERPDIEFAIIPYSHHATVEDARDYRIQHRDEFKNHVFAAKASEITLLGPFKENRDAVDYYNRHTEILQQMTEQVETDQKLGKDIWEKELRNRKKKNIEEAGPDAPGLNEYTRHMSTVAELGAKKGLTKEEQRELAEAKQAAAALREDYEVPDDAIQVDMFINDMGPDGEHVITKKKLYTQAEAPLHLQEDSEFQTRYQPRREEGESLSASYTTKQIVNDKGEKKSIVVPTSKSVKGTRGKK